MCNNMIWIYYFNIMLWLDISREDLPKLPTWDPAQGGPIDRSEIIRLAIDRH